MSLLDTTCEWPWTDNPGCDFVAHTVSMATDWVAGEWAQMGFSEGVWWDFTVRTSPRMYWEVQTLHCDSDLRWSDLGSASGNAKNYYITYSGTAGSCPQNPGKTAYLWYLRKDSSLSTPVYQTWMKNLYG